MARVQRIFGRLSTCVIVSLNPCLRPGDGKFVLLPFLACGLGAAFGSASCTFSGLEGSVVGALQELRTVDSASGTEAPDTSAKMADVVLEAAVRCATTTIPVNVFIQQKRQRRRGSDQHTWVLV
ncbi:hypothetical protein ERJ75_001070900 [Trypanosoma vivax]|nr:hypothetical protein ERJ75_001070900 [Trypanosoma vivax]